MRRLSYLRKRVYTCCILSFSVKFSSGLMIQSEAVIIVCCNFVMNPQTGTPSQTIRIPSPSTVSATPATQDEADHQGPTPATNSTIPCTMQALQTAIRSTGPINTPGMSVSPLMENTLSPSPGQLLTVHDAVQTFSPGLPLIDGTISTEHSLEQLKKKVRLPLLRSSSFAFVTLDQFFFLIQ